MKHTRTLFMTLFLLVGMIISPTQVDGHAPDQSYLYLKVFKESITGKVQITTDDLNRMLNLGLERGLSLSDLSPHLPALEQFTRERVSFTSDLGAHPLKFTGPSLLVLKQLGDFVELNFELDNLTTIPEKMQVKYDILFDQDPKHQGLLVIRQNWKAGIIDNESLPSLVFGKNNTVQELDLSKASVFRGFLAMVGQGIWHILIGLDHILFLLALVLPSVVRRRELSVAEKDAARQGGILSKWFGVALASWEPVERFKPAFWYIFKIVTLFTIAHTITLSLAALEILVLPSRLVESIIAISIALAAYHNIRPIISRGELFIVFGFGLFHGFGFASVLAEKGLSGDYMALTLLGFNLGVEVGQIAIICVIFPLLFFLRKASFYPKVLVYGSVLLILISLYWFIERALDINIGISAPIRWLISKI